MPIVVRDHLAGLKVHCSTIELEGRYAGETLPVELPRWKAKWKVSPVAGSIEHLGGDRWRVRVYVGTGPDGKQHLRNKSFRASGVREARKIGHALGDKMLAARPTSGTVAEAVEAWLAHKAQNGASPTTMASSRSIARRIVADLGTIPLGDLTARHVDAWYGTLRRENIGKGNVVRRRTESTIHHHHRILSSILRQAERWDMVDRVATRKATPPKKTTKRFAVPTPKTMIALLEDADPMLRFAAALIARTGMRRGEAVGLRWSDLDGSTLHVRRSVVQVGKKMTVKATKTGGERDISLGPETVAAFAAHREFLEREAAKHRVKLAADAWVFPRLSSDTRGRVQVPPDWFTKEWGERCTAVGVKVRLHDLRHWHATTLIDRGIPVTTVSARLGHAQTSTTLNVYSHAVRESDVLAAATIEAALRPTPPELTAAEAESSAP